jgi:undecaprenyl-diphosphatase
MDWLIRLDQIAILTIDRHLGETAPQLAAAVITYLGNGSALWLVVAFTLVAIKKYRLTGITVILSIIFSAVLVDLVLKNLVQRPRPFAELPGLGLFIRPPGGYSFPSGHSSSSFAAATVLIGEMRRSWFTPAFITTAALIALSRFVLKVHYPTDVFAGALIGSACGLLARRIVGRFLLRKQERPNEEDHSVP